jgi:type VI secretion system secreted protein Hcp
MAIFLEYEGVTGSATEQNHKGWIQVDSMQWGCGRGIGGTQAGAAQGREASLASLSEVTITKPMDGSSYDFLKEATTGAVPGKKVVIEHVTVGAGNQADKTFKYELEECMVSGYSISSGGDRPTESVSLNFTKITYEIAQGAVDGVLQDPKIGWYDLAEAKGG